MKRFRNLGSKGYTLIEVIIGLALVIGLALASMRLAEYVKETKIRVAAKRELLTLHRMARLLFQNREACNASLSGLTFRGSSIPQLPTAASDLDPGTKPLQNIKLRYLNSDGSEGAPLFLPLNTFGPVKILATELIMPENLTGSDLPTTGLDAAIVPATVAIHSETKFTRGRKLPNPVQRFRVYLSTRTDAAGQSEVLGCGANSLTSQTIFYKPFIAETTDEPLVDGNGKDQFYFCGFMSQLHAPKQYNSTMNAHTSETRCKLTPTGSGPLYNWSITVVAKDGNTRCEVVCL